MAYRTSKRPSRSRSRSAKIYNGKRYTKKVTKRKRAAAPRSQTVRIVIDHVAPQPSSFAEAMQTATPPAKKSRF